MEVGLSSREEMGSGIWLRREAKELEETREENFGELEFVEVGIQGVCSSITILSGDNWISLQGLASAVTSTGVPLLS